MNYRRATPADRDGIIDLINMVFSMDHRPHDFRKLLPKVYGDGETLPAPHFIAVDEGGRVRAVVAMLPQKMRVLDRDINIGYIGSVSVHPRERGQGHFRALMDMAIAAAIDDGMDMLILDGQRQRYGHFGFTPGGYNIEFELCAANLRKADAEGYSFVPMEGADDTTIDFARALYFDQPAYMVRWLSMFPAILKSWQARPMLIYHDGALAGYLVAEGNHITELRLYDPSTCPDVLKAWGADELTITVAPWDAPLVEALKGIAESWTIMSDTRVRILRFAPVMEALLSLKADRQRLSDGETSLWIDGQPLTIRVRNGYPEVICEAPEDAPRLTAMQAQRMLLDPIEALLSDAPSDWLPLPFHMPRPDGF